MNSETLHPSKSKAQILLDLPMSQIDEEEVIAESL